MTHISSVQQRLRITFGKAGSLKYTSNLDIAKIWERVLRRADLPILYTKGFNTRPRMQLAMALPLGITSDCEIIDISLRDAIELDEIPLIEKILAVSPQGLTIAKIESIDIQAPPMQKIIVSAEYRIRFEDGIASEKLQKTIDDILNQDKIVVEVQRKNKRSVYDMRPLIISININTENDLIAHLSVGERGNLRPDQLIQQMGLEQEFISIHRLVIHTS